MTRKRRTAAAAVSAVAIAFGAATAGAEGLHIKSKRSTSWAWTTTDSAGYRWDINANGQVNDGTNDAYDGGLMLRVSGSQFSWGSSGRLNAEGTEVEIGPWTHGATRVWRRIYVDRKAGYCRWIDIFENTSTAKQTLAIQYYSNMGDSTRMTYTTSGKANLTAKDWGIVTGSTSNSSRPAIVHVFATRASKIKPRFQWNQGNDNLYYHVSLQVPAKRTVALCFFEAQRRPFNAAQKFLKEFKPETELRKVPATLRRIILNMGGAILTLGRLELPRHEKHDLVVLRNGNELLGTLRNERFVVETFFGKLELAAGRVVGLSVPIEGEHVELGLVDGQVVCGKLANAPLRFTLATGGDMELPPAKIKTASYKLSSDRPDEIAITAPMIVLRSGERLYFRVEDADLTFLTRYGQVKLQPDHLKAIYLDTPDGGLHRAVFRNGSVVSGLLVVAELKLRLRLGPTLSIRRPVVEKLLFPGAEVAAAAAATMRLRNDDELYGRIVDDKLTVKTRFGSVVVAPKQIVELVFHEASLNRVQIKLRNGTTISGRFEADAIRFQIGGGPILAVSVGHISSVGSATGASKPPSSPKPPAPPTPPVPVPRTRTLRGAIQLERAAKVAPPKPARRPPTKPLPPPDVREAARLKEAEARLKAMKAALAQVQGKANAPAKVLEMLKKRIAAEEAKVQQLTAQARERAKVVAAVEADRQAAAKMAKARRVALAKRDAVLRSRLAAITKKQRAAGISEGESDKLKREADEVRKALAEIEKALAAANRVTTRPASRPAAAKPRTAPAPPQPVPEPPPPPEQPRKRTGPFRY